MAKAKKKQGPENQPNVESKPKFQIFDPQSDIAKKFDYYIKIVVGVLVVAVLTMLFMVAGVLLDAWHFNSAVYKEYSSKIDTLDTLNDANKLLLEQNAEQQSLILEQQEQLKILLDNFSSIQKP